MTPIDYGLSRLQEAQASIASAERFFQRAEREEAESVARGALELFRSAMNWLEDTEEFERAHELIDLAGAYVRRTFGCSLHQEGTSYSQRCPVALAHNRAGMSVAYVVQGSECSICGEDPNDCAHIAGRVYDGSHCYRLITQADILEISVVRRPRQPDARITSMSVSLEDLQASLGPSWRPGMPVSCDRCLLPCDGVQELPETLGTG